MLHYCVHTFILSMPIWCSKLWTIFNIIYNMDPLLCYFPASVTTTVNNNKFYYISKPFLNIKKYQLFFYSLEDSEDCLWARPWGVWHKSAKNLIHASESITISLRKMNFEVTDFLLRMRWQKHPRWPPLQWCCVILQSINAQCSWQIFCWFRTRWVSWWSWWQRAWCRGLSHWSVDPSTESKTFINMLSRNLAVFLSQKPGVGGEIKN